MSCVTKKTLTELLFILRVLSQNVGNCFHVLFMGLSLVWNIGDVDEWIFACVRQSTAKRVNFHSKKLIALVHMFSTLHFFLWGIMEFIRLLSIMREIFFLPILDFLSCTPSSCECVYFRICLHNNGVIQGQPSLKCLGPYFNLLQQFILLCIGKFSCANSFSTIFFNLKSRLSCCRGSVPKLAAQCPSTTT